MEMTSLERELICPICDDYYTTPLLLPCQHNVCHKCAKDQALSTSSQDVTNVSIGHSSSESLNLSATSPTSSIASLPITSHSASSLRATFRRRATLSGPSPTASSTPLRALPRESPGSGSRRESLPSGVNHTLGVSPRGRSATSAGGNQPTTFYCPTCHDHVVLGEKGLNGLYRNFALEVIVDRFKLAAKKAASIPCGLCKVRPPLDATKSCLDCKLSYCNACYKHHHPWGTPRAQHEYIGPTHNYRPKTITCTEHTHEKVTMYCDGCQKPVCHRCKFSGAHAHHKISIIERKYALVKEKMENHLEAIREKRDQLKRDVNALSGLCNKVEENGALAREKLSLALTSLQTTLADRSSVLTQATDEEITRRVLAVKIQLDTYQDILKGCSVVDLAQEMLKEKDKACFVQAARPILGRLIETVNIIKGAKLSPVHAFHDFSNLSINDTAAAEALQNLDFHKAPTDAPVISTKRCQSYNHVIIEWDPPTSKSPVQSYTLEYRKLVRPEGTRPPTPTTQRRMSSTPRGETNSEEQWAAVQGIKDCRHCLTDLSPDSRYKFRVRGENQAGKGECSKIVILKTVPAPVFPFKWTSCSLTGATSPSISKDGQRVTQRPNPNLLSPTTGPIPSSPVALDPAFCLGDRKITNGKHYWEVIIDQSPCVVQIGVISERRVRRLGDPVSSHGDGDSGHDSSDELDTDHASRSVDPTVLINYHGGKVYLPNETAKNSKKAGSNGIKHTTHALTSCAVGVCVDADKGRVHLTDGDTKESFYSSDVTLEGAVYPCVVIIGPGVVKSRQIGDPSLDIGL